MSSLNCFAINEDKNCLFANKPDHLINSNDDPQSEFHKPTGSGSSHLATNNNNADDNNNNNNNSNSVTANVNSSSSSSSHSPLIVNSNNSNNNNITVNNIKQSTNGSTIPFVDNKQSLQINSDQIQIINGVSSEQQPGRCPISSNGLSQVNPGSGQSNVSQLVSNTKKPFKLTNVSTGASSVDILHQSAIENVPCESKLCGGSLMKPVVVTGKHRRTREEILFYAKHFFDQYYTSIKRLNSPAHEERWAQVKASIEKQGTYSLKETELIFGAKLAWRNAPRCIGRIQWSKLQVFDARTAATAKDMFDAICNHIKYATNKGNLRSAITIFPQRTGDSPDFRIWNQQLISYAGYPDPDSPERIIGDPINVEFTQICINLGWKPPKTPWDILPIVVSASGQNPQIFIIPEELVLRVPLEHPTFDWFKDLNLQWYALPAVSSMLLDVGGIEFPAIPFSGWYMVTEIACRDLCDTNRYNILQTVAEKMGLDTRSNMTLWKDTALVEVNKAVIDSYHKLGVTIVDHHTAAESFMKHLENEQRLRGGCPADWVWIIPPTAGSLTPVFHQEMANYILKPSFEYQEPAWKSHSWNISPNGEKSIVQARKKKFKEIARAVKFTSNLFGKALSKRVKATILYATETGRSEEYAKRLEQIFSFAFNVTVMCMDSYDIFQLEHETLLLIVTSTFGNGDPPENGESFARQLQAIKVTGDTTPDIESVRSVSTSLLRISTMGSYEGRDTPPNDAGTSQIGPLSNISIHKGNSLELKSSSPATKILIEDGKLLEEVGLKKSEITKRFAVFGLGSSAYPNFCAFAKYLDNMLGELGGERIHKLLTGDELCGQEQSFNQWSKTVFTEACNVFCISDEINMHDVMKTAALKPKIWSVANVKLVPSNQSNSTKSPINIVKALTKSSNRKVIPFCLVNTVPLHKGGYNERQTIRVILEQDSTGLEHGSESGLLSYSPGDHLGIFPENRSELVQAIMERLSNIDFKTVYNILVRKPIDDDSNDIEYIPHEKLGPVSVEEALTRYLDITTPPTQQLLSLLSQFCKDDRQKVIMERLATDGERYEEWKAYYYPNLLELLTEFNSLEPPPEVLLTQLPILQPRFYSISSSQQYYSWEEASARANVVDSPDSANSLIMLDNQSIVGNLTSTASVMTPKRPESLCKDNCYGLLSSSEEFTGFDSNRSPNAPPTLVTMSSVASSTSETILRRLSAVKVDLTVAVVNYRTQSGAQHHGVCSNFLSNIGDGHQVFGFLRSAPNFRMPDDHSIPIIMVGPGTGIAPFRAFWLERYAVGLINPAAKPNFGKMSLFFGCRLPTMELYSDETRFMIKEKILSSVKVAYSRLPDQPKRYVQDLLRASSEEVLHCLMKEKGHFYVCGDVSMAEGVSQTLRSILQDSGYEDPDVVIMYLRQDNRYHEDIFGITLRTDEVRRKGRNVALNRKSLSTA